MSHRATEDQVTCRDFVELVTDLIEGQLDQARRLEAEAHAGDCPDCARFLAQVRMTITALRGLAAGDDFPRTREQAAAAFRDLRQNGGATP